MGDTADLKTGDVVQLRTGGDPMTVERCDGDFVWAVWFDAAGQLQGRLLPLEDLRVLGRIER